MFDDDYGLGGMGATSSVLRGLSESLAHVILVNHGDQALPLMRTVIARQISGRYRHGEAGWPMNRDPFASPSYRLNLSLY